MSNSKSSTLCKILFLEDEEEDVKLMRHELDLANFKNISKRVVSKKEFLETLENFKPDIIVSAYSLPLFNGMHAFKLFKEKNIGIPFILVTGVLDDALSRECVGEGVDDFILKPRFERLPSVIERNLEIKKAGKKRKGIPAELSKKNEEPTPLQEEVEKEKMCKRLSSREFEILCLIASGKTIKEIACQLFLSPPTVTTYRARLLEKTHLKSNVDLTRYAILNKLVD